MKESYSTTAIIGGGPAGMSCAMQLKRFGIDCVLFEKEHSGGMLHNAHFIENYPGFPRGIAGYELAKLLQQQADRFSVQIRKTGITSVDYSGGHFVLEGTDFVHRCRRLVVASGTKPLAVDTLLIDPEAEKFILREVYPLRKVEDKTIVIVGAGDAAFDYALSLAPLNRVFILNRSSRVKALAALVKKVKKERNIRYYENVSVQEIIATSEGLSVVTGGDSFNAHFLIFAIGRMPALDFLSSEIKAKLDELLTKQLLFMIGDVKNKAFRQMAIAAGDAIKCAMQINEVEK